MRITATHSYHAQGTRDTMQDHTYVVRSADGAYYLGVFDGHGAEGDRAASAGCEAIDLASSSAANRSGFALEKANVVRKMLKFVSGALENDNIDGGSTATVAVYTEEDDELAVVWLGDSQAYYFSDRGRIIPLIRPHTAKNLQERGRVRALGYSVTQTEKGYLYFGGVSMISRSLGDRYPFMSHDGQVSSQTLRTAGTLVVASDGLWGSSPIPVESAIRNRTFNQTFVEAMAAQNEDNATAVTARIE